jgi:hypothetical protein
LNTHGQRSDLKDTRSSAAKIIGCSHAAKWPPFTLSSDPRCWRATASPDQVRGRLSIGQGQRTRRSTAPGGRLYFFCTEMMFKTDRAPLRIGALSKGEGKTVSTVRACEKRAAKWGARRLLAQTGRSTRDGTTMKSLDTSSKIPAHSGSSIQGRLKLTSTTTRRSRTFISRAYPDLTQGVSNG